DGGSVVVQAAAVALRPDLWPLVGKPSMGSENQRWCSRRKPHGANGSRWDTGHARSSRSLRPLGSAHVMRDFTLVIPTGNGAQRLTALLSYLEAQEADCQILVLDSSRAEVLAANRARVAESRLDTEFAAFPDLEFGEKRRLGIH